MPTGQNPTYVSGSEGRPLPKTSNPFNAPPKAKPTGLDWDALRETAKEQA